MKHLWGLDGMVPFCPVPFCPRVPFCPNIPCSNLPPRLRLEKSHYVNYKITRCSIKSCEYENKRYIIISNHMQRFYHLICQRSWWQNASKLIYQKGEITFLWDAQNMVYCKFDFDMWRWTGWRQKSSGCENRPTPGQAFFKTSGVPFCPHVPFCPDLLYILSSVPFCETMWNIKHFNGKTGIGCHQPPPHCHPNPHPTITFRLWNHIFGKYFQDFRKIQLLLRFWKDPP